MRMDAKKNTRMWAISLFVISIATIILAGANIIGIVLPDIVTRSLGVMELIALPILAFSTVKMFKGKDNDECCNNEPNR